MTNRTTEELLKDAEEFIKHELSANTNMLESPIEDAKGIITALAAKLTEREWQLIDHDNPNKYEDPGLWGLWVKNGKTGVSTFETCLLYLDDEGNVRTTDDCGDYSDETFDCFTYWMPQPQPPKKDE